MLLGFRPVGYVEWNDYCQRVLAARIRDGILHDAPVFGDVKAFIRDGYAESYTGMVDVLTAGFPCQPFSVAGKRKHADDERNMWPATADVIGIVRPRFVLLENVPGIRRYLPVVVRDLRRRGYDVQRPLQLGADDVGAPHKRKRIWIMAHTLGDGTGWKDHRSTDVADADGKVIRPGLCPDESEGIGWGRSTDGGSEIPDLAAGAGQPAGAFIKGRRAPPRWPTEPDMGRVANGVAHRVDRIRAIGNGQVSRVVAAAWRILTQ